jgi:MscS family membrane protein
MREWFGEIIEQTAGWGWAFQAFAVVLATLIVARIAGGIVSRLEKRAAATGVALDDALLRALQGPERGLVWVIGIAAAAHIVGASTEAANVLFDALPTLRSLGIVAMLTWFLLRFVRCYEDAYVAGAQAQGEAVDWTFVRAAGKLVRAAIAITAALIALQALGVNIAGLLAFGGVGGIAVGMAARDLLANVFGGFTIYLDRPFKVGEWIRSPDQEIEGTVEEIGWRRTLIRTFDQRPLYVPNAVFTTISVENPSRMTNRRIHETIGVRYDDFAKVPAILADVREFLKTDPDIDQGRTLMVNFNSFGDSSLDFFVYTFTRTTVWTEFHAIKERVLLTIGKIIESHGAEIAYPTRTLHVASGPSGEPETKND